MQTNSSALNMTKFFRNNGLSLVLMGMFLILLFGQAVAGFHQSNQEKETHGRPIESFGEYVSGSHFLESVFENWESEFLQMAAYVIFTVFLFQKGSSESKDPEGKEDVDEDPLLHRHDPDAPGPVRQGGWRLKLYQQSLFLAFLALFLASWVGHAFSGHALYNDELKEHGVAAISLGQYL